MSEIVKKERPAANGRSLEPISIIDDSLPISKEEIRNEYVLLGRSGQSTGTEGS